MPSIMGELIRESSRKNIDAYSLRKNRLTYLLEAEGADEKKVDTAMQKSAKSLKTLAGSLKDGMPETSVLVAKAGENLTKAIAAGEKDEESAALFSLSNQFGASLLSMLNSINSALETDEGSAESSIVKTLGGDDELKKIIEKTFKPSPSSIKLIQQANELVAKAKEITKAGAASGAVDAKSEADEAEGRGSEDVFEMEDVKDVDEGLFSNIGNFLKGLFKQVPTDAKGTIKSLMPLFGGGNIAKALLNDLKKESLTGASFGDTLKAITPSLNDLSPGTSEKVEPPAAGGGGEGGGSEGAATPAAGASVAADNPDFAKAVAAAVEKALGERGAGAAAAVRDIGTGTDPKKATSGLDDETKALMKVLLSRLGSEGADADPKAVVSAAAKESGAAEGGGEGELKYSKYIDAEKIKKVAGDKGPKAVDSLLAGSEDLRKKLGIKDSRNRGGRLVRESMFSLMFEEVDADAVKAIKTGLKKDEIGKELSDDEAKEIAQSIADKAGGATKEGGGGDEKSLSSLLFVENDPEDKSKGYRLRKKIEPGSKTGNIKMYLDRIAGEEGSGRWHDVVSKPNSANRKNFMTDLQKLADELKGVKLESNSNDNDVILERWQRLAGLKD